MTILHATIQGIIQGLTEFLPVSSSGHLSVFQYLTGINSESSLVFSVILHLGTLLAVCIAFYDTIWELIKAFGLLIRDIFTLRILKEPGDSHRRMLYLFIVSCIPLFVVLLVNDKVEGLTADNSIIAEGIFFLITSLILTVACKVQHGRKNAVTMTYPDAVIIGIAQLFAIFPGISRSGSTISAGLIRGLDKKYAMAYSFILGMPTVLAAAILELSNIPEGGEPIQFGVAAIGIITSTIFGLLSIRLVNFVLKKDKFSVFAVYTLVIGLIVTGIGITDHFTGHAVQHFFSALVA